jgi:UDP-N-acetylglucosamine/UDP-N-acetylgalactosamine diphosphorylase
MNMQAMNSEKAPQNIEKTLKKHKQQHLLSFWEHLDQAQRKQLIKQIEALDFSQIDGWIERYVKNPVLDALTADLKSADSYRPIPEDPGQISKYGQAVKMGKKLISSGKVAAFVVAGGQGTRLGFEGPKGNFPISPVKNKTLFQIFAETIKAVNNRYQTGCPWYIMTSPLNDADTKEIFRSNNYYGLDEQNVMIFQQGTLPNFSFDGKILLADKGTIASSPDGHGGSLKALCESGAVEDMKKRGVEFVSYYQVDNPLINIFDPLFIGLHALDNSEMSSKALLKNDPLEKVGNFCLADGKVTVIEYSDLSDEQAKKRNPDGSLVFELGSIAIHIINRSFIEKLGAKGFSLPMHRAIKEIQHIEKDGEFVTPQEPNVIKLETFVFDALPLASKSIILQTIREQEFGPVKNAAGTDSAETAREMMIARAADWLEAAGVKVPRKEDGSPDCIIEISPEFAVEKDDIKQKLKQIPEIKSGDKVYLT